MRSSLVEFSYNNEIPGPKGCPLVYSGYRASDSNSIHRHLSNGSENSYFYERQESGAGRKTEKEQSVAEEYGLVFDSKFESGNLDKVYKVSDCEYDLYMRSDTNTEGHFH